MGVGGAKSAAAAQVEHLGPPRLVDGPPAPVANRVVVKGVCVAPDLEGGAGRRVAGRAAKLEAVLKDGRCVDVECAAVGGPAGREVGLVDSERGCQADTDGPTTALQECRAGPVQRLSMCP